MVLVGITLQPDYVYLDLLADVIRDDADYYEVAPETLWGWTEDGTLVANGFHREFAALHRETGKPMVAHGVGLSMGTTALQDQKRQEFWLDRIAADHQVFDFAWYTDHLGASSVAGLNLTLPVALPYDDDHAKALQNRLRQMQRVTFDVGVENSVFYFHLGDVREEPRFLSQALREPGFHLLLDLHNVYTTAVNVGFDPDEYLAALPLDRVIEIHISGGSRSHPGWLPGGETLRLDSHDSAVPEPVWQLAEEIVPRCPRLRGLTLERMEGTVLANDVSNIRDELHRAKALVQRDG